MPKAPPIPSTSTPRPEPYHRTSSVPLGRVGAPVGGGLHAFSHDRALIQRIRSATLRAAQNEWTLASLANGIIAVARTWANDNTVRSRTSAQRMWREFCDIFGISPPIISDRSIDDRERLGLAFLGYMFRCIKARNDHPSWETVNNYTTAVREFHRQQGAREDIWPMMQMPTLRYARFQLQSFLNAHAPFEPAKPLVNLDKFMQFLGCFDLRKPFHAVIAGAVRTATFTGRRMGDFLPRKRCEFHSKRHLSMNKVCLDLKAGRVNLVCSITKNRRAGPHWYGVLTRNAESPNTCPVAAIEAYLGHLASHGGDMSHDAPFFQRFDKRTGRFTGEPLVVSDVSAVTDTVLNKLGAKQHGQSVHFRVEMANLLIIAGVAPGDQSRFMDWKEHGGPLPARRHYARLCDPFLAATQQVVYKAFAEHVRQMTASPP